MQRCFYVQEHPASEVGLWHPYLVYIQKKNIVGSNYVFYVTGVKGGKKEGIKDEAYIWQPQFPHREFKKLCKFMLKISIK